MNKAIASLLGAAGLGAFFWLRKQQKPSQSTTPGTVQLEITAVEYSVI